MVQGADAWGPLAQGELLLRLGAEARLARLVRGQPPARADSLRQGIERLIDPAQMGALFVALALSRGDAPPPGFTPEDRYRP